MNREGIFLIRLPPFLKRNALNDVKVTLYFSVLPIIKKNLHTPKRAQSLCFGTVRVYQCGRNTQLTSPA